MGVRGTDVPRVIVVVLVPVLEVAREGLVVVVATVADQEEYRFKSASVEYSCSKAAS